MGNESTRTIRFSRGVKQGDPLSPILFNLVVDELITEANLRRPGGTITGHRRVSAIDFADDLVLLEDRDIDMAISLDFASRFYTARGMALNLKKCVAISVAKSVIPLFHLWLN